MKKKIINYALLRKVKAQILKEPRQFFMDWWTTADPSYARVGRSIPNCGTAACVAGWTVSLKRRINPSSLADGSDIGTAARRALRITEEQGNHLFNASKWPQPFLNQWGKTASSPIKRAAIAAARIDHFIKTKGAE